MSMFISMDLEATKIFILNYSSDIMDVSIILLCGFSKDLLTVLLGVAIILLFSF